MKGFESAPLAPHAATSPADGFERLDAARTGLDFTHRWIPPHRYPSVRHTLLSTSHAGGGVCIGDYDDDGLPDVFLTRPHGGNRLYRNLGGFRFADVTDEAGLAEAPDRKTWGTGATFVDIDNDDDLDLYVCAYDGPNRLYVNQGDGTFEQRAEAFGLAFEGASICMAFADYDRDGDLDGYLLTNRIVSAQWRKLSYRFRDGRPVMEPDHRESAKLLIHPDGHAEVVRAGQVDHLYRNNGDGSFTDATAQALGDAADGNHFGLSATWWDYDDDGWPDLYVANDFWGPDHLYRNNGDATFTDVIRTALPHTPWFSMGSDAGDLNNDGRLDFMAADMSGTTHFKKKMGMGDMNAYGWFLERPEPRQVMRNAVYLNTGTPRFMEVAKLTGLADTDWTWSVKIADLDNDGHQDVFVTNGTTRDWMNSDLQQRGTGALIDSPPRREKNLAFRNLGDLQFENTAEAWGLDHYGVSFGAALADLDGAVEFEPRHDVGVIAQNFYAPVVEEAQTLAADRHHAKGIFGALPLGLSLAAETAVEGAAQTAIGGDDDEEGALTGRCAEQGMLRRITAAAESGQNTVEVNGIRPSRLDAFLGAPHFCGGHHLHRIGDALNVADAGDSRPQLT